MSPELILSTIKSTADALTEIFKYLQTPAGQAAMKKLTEDQVAFEANLKAFGDWFTKFVTGKL